MLQGIDVRLHAELSACMPPSMRVRVIAPPERKFATWLGGSILFLHLSSMWVLRQVYDEIGPVCARSRLEAGKIKATKSKKATQQEQARQQQLAEEKARAERLAWEQEVEVMREEAILRAAARQKKV